MNPALDITTDAKAVRPTGQDPLQRCPLRPRRGRRQCRPGRPHPGRVGVGRFPRGRCDRRHAHRSPHRQGVPIRRVKIADTTRESFTINEVGTGLQYRFVLPGPRLTFAEQEQCLDELRLAATSAKFVVASEVCRRESP